MSDDPCRKFLTEAGFKDIEAEEIINNLSNQSNLDIIKEIKTASDAEELLKTSNEISKRRSIQSITALNDGLTNNQRPFKMLWNFLVGKNGLWINAQARSEMRNARILREMQLSNRQLSKKLDDELFVENLIEEMNPFNGIQKGTDNDAFKLAKILVEEKKMQVLESRNYGSGTGWRDDHITTTWHDAVRILETDPAIWKEHIKGFLNIEKTLKNVKKGKVAFLGNLVATLVEHTAVIFVVFIAHSRNIISASGGNF